MAARANQASPPTAHVTVDLDAWREFVRANKVARKPADDYYELTQPSGPPLGERECALLTRLLWDAEEVGAIKPGVELNVVALVVAKAKVPLGVPGTHGVYFDAFFLSGLGDHFEVDGSAVRGLRCDAAMGSRAVEHAIEAVASPLRAFVRAAQP